MQKHLLELADDYSLIGIHTSEEDYRLAYLINKNLNTSFSKFEHYLDFENNKASFSVFEYLDEENQLNNYLISNKFIGNDTTNRQPSLFTDSIFYSSTSYLIPEKKNIDYFLKIEGDITLNKIKNTIENLNNIFQIITSYNINPSNLKSKDFLIF